MLSGALVVALADRDHVLGADGTESAEAPNQPANPPQLAGPAAPVARELADGVRVRIDGELVPLSEVVRRAAVDQRLTTYRQLRAAHGATAAGQLDLARWCRKQGLEEEERLHWRILQFIEPGHPEAAKALRLQKYRGKWLTRDEVDVLRKEKKLSDAADRRWSPKLRAIKQSLDHGDAAARRQALRDLEAIDDSYALPLVAKTLANEDTEVGLLVVEMFARITKDKSAQGLVRLAVESPDPAVREKAASHLRYLPRESYVPYLIAGLAAPLELSSYVAVEPGGPTYEQFRDEAFTGRIVPGLFGVVRLSGNYTNRDVLIWSLETKTISGIRQSGYRPDRIQYNYVLTRESPDPNAPYEYRGAIESRSDERSTKSLPDSVAALKAKIQELNAETAQRNRRIHAALTEATGADVAPGQFVGGPPDADVHPRLWWEWWRKQLNLNHYFAQGIEVWTDAGLRPIEQVLVGDRVLTRDPQSEELTLNLVIGIDARPQDSMRIIEVDSRTIVATPEQPFFVADEGWRDADKLEPGIELDGFAGPERIEKIESSTASSTYSLLIENVPNFFVDQQGILVHDATRR